MLFVVAAAAGLVLLAVLAALGLLVMALVGLVMGADRLVATLVPAYRRRRRDRYVSMPAGLIRVVRFGSGAAAQVIDARSYERPERAEQPERTGGALEP